MSSSSLLTLHADVTGDLLEKARACEEDVFLQAFGNTREQLDEEYGPYDDCSSFLTVTDADDNVLGITRLIWHGPLGLKTLNDVAAEPWNLDGYRSFKATGLNADRCFDVATLGVRKEYRGQRMMASLALFHGMMRAMEANECDGAMAIIDNAVWQIFMGVSAKFHVIPGAFTVPYLGSPESTPVYTDRSELWSLIHQQDPDMYRLLAQGTGLDGVSLPAPEAFRR